MKPTKEQIAVEIKTLKAQEPKVREYTMFGDNNRKAIAAQIRVMEEDLSIDEIDDKYEDEYYVHSNAEDALNWLLNAEEDKPSDGWSTLVQG